MFRSRRREIVVPQAEHARLAGHIAGHWGNDDISAPGIGRERLALAVALHDRGYPDMDTLPIGEISTERWIETLARGAAMEHPDPVVDLVALAHIRRLLSGRNDPASAALIRYVDGLIGERLPLSGLTRDTLGKIDEITRSCDMISFWLSFEMEGHGLFPLSWHRSDEVRFMEVTVEACGEVRISPWPLSVDELNGELRGYQAAGYPRRPEIAPISYRIIPA